MRKQKGKMIAGPFAGGTCPAVDLTVTVGTSTDSNVPKVFLNCPGLL